MKQPNQKKPAKPTEQQEEKERKLPCSLQQSAIQDSEAESPKMASEQELGQSPSGAKGASQEEKKKVFQSMLYNFIDLVLGFSVSCIKRFMFIYFDKLPNLLSCGVCLKKFWNKY